MSLRVILHSFSIVRKVLTLLDSIQESHTGEGLVRDFDVSIIPFSSRKFCFAFAITRQEKGKKISRELPPI